MSTSLTVGAANAASTTLSTANQLYSVANGGTPANTQDFTLIDNSTGYVPLFSQGNPSVNGVVGSIANPGTHGFLWDVTTLEGQTIAAGNWSGNIRLSSQQAQAFTADIYRFAYKRSSGGTFTLIVQMLLATQVFNGTNTSYSLTSTSASSMAFSTGDKLYIEEWLHITVNTGTAGQQVRYNRLSTDTTTFTFDTNTQTVTPGYQATTVTKPPINHIIHDGFPGVVYGGML
jgi:hypothetical protein